MAINTVKAQLLSGVEGINFDEVTLTLNEEGYYVAQLTAPLMSSYNLEDNVFNIKITATTVGGNSDTIDKTDETLGNSCRLRVYEKQAPAVEITSPTSDNAYITNSSTVVTFTATDVSYGGIKDAGLDLNSLSFVLSKDGVEQEILTSDLTYVESDGIYTYTYKPTAGFSDGKYSVTISISDYDGNISNIATRSFVVDTAAPSIDINAPAISNSTEVTITGTTDADETITVTIIANEQQYNLNPQTDGSFSQVVTLVEGNNEIQAYATDVSGNRSETVTKTVLVDTSIPVFTEVVLEPNPVDGGASLILKVKVIAQV